MGDAILIIVFMLVIGLAALEIRNIVLWINKNNERKRAFDKWLRDNKF